MKRFSLAAVAAVAAVALIVGVKFSSTIRPQLARIPVVGKFLV